MHFFTDFNLFSASKTPQNPLEKDPEAIRTHEHTSAFIFLDPHNHSGLKYPLAKYQERISPHFQVQMY